MVKFGFGAYSTELSNWSKHHKEVGVLVKRVYSDGETVETDNETLLLLMKENKNLLKEKAVRLFNAKGERTATDYYFPIQNQEYKDGNLPFYSVGAMNTKQTTRIRYHFQIEESTFKLESSFKSSGSHAVNFFNVIERLESEIEDAIEEILEKDLNEDESLKEFGLAKGYDEDFKIFVVTDVLEVVDIEISKQELLNSLVGVEIYEFDQEIE